MNLCGIELAKMQEKHVGDIYLIEKICFSNPWTEEGIRSELKNKNARFTVALKDEKVIGYVGMYNVCSCGYITNIAVLPEYRRNGVAKRLLKEIIFLGTNEDMEFISLEVRKSNAAAIGLYKDLGFKNVGVRKNFYTKPIEDAIIMTKFLGSEL